MQRTPEPNTEPTTCQRCGTCCVNGGPALHRDDLPLIQDHRLALTDLLSIREGEPVFSPLINGLEPSRSELIKIAGYHDSWACRFFSQAQNACGCYAYRPVECRLLKCWAPSALTDIIYQQCLTRRDVLPEDDDLWELIGIQEAHCSFAMIAQLTTDGGEIRSQSHLAEVGRIINLDLKIRQRAIQTRRLSVAEELLYFGRPMFKSLGFYRLAIKEGINGISIIPDGSFGTKR